jgi:glycoprotein-N-acetylgalactosamine 3-beta-galactosyltransferase
VSERTVDEKLIKSSIKYFSYIIVENLRHLLSQYNPKTALYFGHRYSHPYLGEGYMAGGGYVLSRKALKKFGDKLIHNATLCHANGLDEDLEMGNCLAHSAIFVDCRDAMNQKRFFPIGMKQHFDREMKDMTYWYLDRLYYNATQGNLSCCSDTSVSHHYIKPQKMYMLEYYIYKVSIFGNDDNTHETLPRKFSLEEIIKASDAKSSSKSYKPHRDYHDIERSDEN